MTWDTLFAAIGGIFGLCLGGSILSIVELIFFFTFKLYVMIHTEHGRLSASVIKQETVSTHQSKWNEVRINHFFHPNRHPFVH